MGLVNFGFGVRYAQEGFVWIYCGWGEKVWSLGGLSIMNGELIDNNVVSESLKIFK